MDVNFNGSLWWCNILQLCRGKKCSAQIFAKGSHSIAYCVRLILSLGQGFSHNWHRHCQIWSACQIGIAHPHEYYSLQMQLNEFQSFLDLNFHLGHWPFTTSGAVTAIPSWLPSLTCCCVSTASFSHMHSLQLAAAWPHKSCYGYSIYELHITYPSLYY